MTSGNRDSNRYDLKSLESESTHIKSLFYENS